MKKEFLKIMSDEFDCLEQDLEFVIEANEDREETVLRCMKKAFDLCYSVIGN